MKRYRNIYSDVTYEAIEVTPASRDEAAEWVNGKVTTGPHPVMKVGTYTYVSWPPDHFAWDGQWIIKDLDGRFGIIQGASFNTLFKEVSGDESDGPG